MTTEAAPSSARTRDDRSIAEWFCLVVGATLIIAGLLGFLVEPKFDTSVGGDPGQIDGEKLLLFEVNGWHNVVHLLTGAFLLVFGLRRRPGAARTAALAFGVVYLVVTVVGLIDGQDIVALVPINPADNVLHALLAITAIAAALMTRVDPDRERRLGARDRDDDDASAGRASGPPVGGARASDDFGPGALRRGADAERGSDPGPARDRR